MNQPDSNRNSVTTYRFESNGNFEPRTWNYTLFVDSSVILRHFSVEVLNPLIFIYGSKVCKYRYVIQIRHLYDSTDIWKVYTSTH